MPKDYFKRIENEQNQDPNSLQSNIYDLLANAQRGVNVGPVLEVLGDLNTAAVLVGLGAQVKVYNNDASIQFVYFGDVSGLITAITLANSLRTVLNAHAADAVEHTIADIVSFPLSSPVAVELNTLINLTTEMLTAYEAHDTDAKLAVPVIHIAQYGGSDLVSSVAPTTVAECVTRLNDLKAKYNIHDFNGTAHTAGNTHQEGTTDAAAALAVPTVANGFPVAPGEYITICSGQFSHIRASDANVLGYKILDDTTLFVHLTE